MKRFAALMLALGIVATTAGAANAQYFRAWTNNNSYWHNSWNNNNWQNNNWNNNWRWRQHEMRRIYRHDNGLHRGWRNDRWDRHRDHDRRWW